MPARGAKRKPATRGQRRAVAGRTEVGGRMLRKVPLSEAKTHFSSLIDEIRAGGDPIVIGRRQKEVAVLVDLQAFKRLQEFEDTLRNEQLRRALEGPMKPLDDVLRGLDLGL